MGQHQIYTQEEKNYVLKHSTLPRRELAKKFSQKFGRSVTHQSMGALCKRNRWYCGRSGRFDKGHVPFNANTKGLMRSNKTSFKQGHVPHNTKYVGHERVDKNGYLWISIKRTNPHTGFHRHYILKHRWVWEQANGSVPDGMCLKFRDSNRRNCELSNLECIERALLPTLARKGYDQAPPELKETIMLQCKLQHLARTVDKR